MIQHVRVGVDGYGGDVQLAPGAALVERLDVLEDVLEFVAARIDLALRHRVEHEGIVRIGGVSEGQVFVRRHNGKR
jgi:hypothetical protein